MAVGGLGGALAATRLHRLFTSRAIVITYPWLGAAAMLLLVLRLPPLAMGAIFGVVGLLRPGVRRDRRGAPDPPDSPCDAGRAPSVVYLLVIGGAALGPLLGGVLVSLLGGARAFPAIGLFGVLLASAATLSRALRDEERPASVRALGT